MTSETPGTARLIVCERTGRWAVALRRELAGGGVRVHQTRSQAECWGALASWPAAFVVVELTASGAEALLRRMAKLNRDFPRARVAVVSDRSLSRYEWLVRELGAVHYTCSPRRLVPLGGLICRHLAQVPPLQQSFTERIWASLPWKSQEPLTP